MAIMSVVRSMINAKLIVCFLGIFISYFVYGLLQENMYV